MIPAMKNTRSIPLSISLEDLYTPEILALATAVPHVGTLDAPQGEAVKHSPLCGSRVAAQVRLDDAGRVADFAQMVHACALGQASAAILGKHIIGAGLAELEEGRAALARMLKEEAPPPEEPPWRELATLRRVRDVPQRHAAVLLPFDAAIAAVRNALEMQERYP